jgi:serine/threonine protein kinase
MPHHPLALGELTNARFQRLRMLGRGSFGVAWEVRDTLAPTSSPTFALKLVELSSLSEKGRETALGEARILQLLPSHIGIVKYFGSWLEGSVLHILLECCDSGDLAGLISRARVDGTEFSEEAILHHFCQLASALFAVHNHGLLHRDVKCANIFLQRGALKLADFGIARELNDDSVASTIIGTPTNMSPERVDGP